MVYTSRDRKDSAVHRRCSAATVTVNLKGQSIGPMKTDAADENSPLCPKKDVPGLESGGPPKFQRTIGVLSASAILFGNCVGAGIFISPKGVYDKTGSGGAGLITWTLAGLIATLCTIAYAELGTMMQDSGGEFVYIKKAYGRLPAFLFSFTTAFLIKPAAMSVVAATFGEYLCSLIWGINYSPIMIKTAAAGLIVFMGVINIISSKLIIKFCSVSAMLKLGLVGFLLTCGVAIAIKGEVEVENFRPATAFAGSTTNPADYGLALFFCLFSFQAWNSLNFMTEELKEPEKTMPWGGFCGLLAVSISYVLANVTYLMLFSVPQIMESSTIAMDCGYRVYGRVGELVMCIGLLISCMGCIGGSMFCISRNIQSTGEQDVFPRWMGNVNKTTRTPVPAILIVVVTMCFYLMFDVTLLIPCLGTAEWFFYCVTFSCLIYLRYKEPHTHRPVKIPMFLAVGLFLITGILVILPLFKSDSRMSVIIGLCSLPIGSILYGARLLFLRLCGSSEDGHVSSKCKNVSESSSSDSGYQETFGRDNKVR